MSAYAYLNIEDPICAWATYRGVLVTPPDIKGFVSVWHAGILKSQSTNRVLVEQRLESVREQYFTSCVSRLRGMFCFMDLESAKLAADSWGNNNSNHFSTSNLAELELYGATDCLKQFDANWITWAHANPGQALKNNSWIDKYWDGQPRFEEEPIWETLHTGQASVLGTKLRNKAYERIKHQFPNSLALLETARISALLKSDLGSISGFIASNSDAIRLQYYINMQDADNPIFLKCLEEFLQSGQPVNHNDLAPHFRKESFGNVPDLRPYGHTWII